MSVLIFTTPFITLNFVALFAHSVAFNQIQLAFSHNQLAFPHNQLAFFLLLSSSMQFNL
jgi:hypothetical protein